MFQLVIAYLIGVIIGYKVIPYAINKINNRKNKKGDKN